MIKVYRILDIVLNEKNERKSISYVEIDGCKKEVYLDDIAYIQAEGSYARLRLNNDVGDVIIVSKKLGQIEKEFEWNLFAKIKEYLIYATASDGTVYKKGLKDLQYIERKKWVSLDVKRKMWYISESITNIKNINAATWFDDLITNYNKYLYLKKQIIWK